MVDRTFLGALVVSAFSYLPFKLALYLGSTKLVGLYISRLVLGILNLVPCVLLKSEVSRKLGKTVGLAFTLLTACQFHLPFYMSRTLPNTFALCVCLWAYYFWLKNKFKHVAGCVALGGVLFRCDLVILAVSMGLVMVKKLQVKYLIKCLAIGVLVSLLGVLVSVLVDSWFWGRWTWPELNVLIYNTYYNKSADWGVMPWHWYLSVAIPKLLLTQIVSFGFGALSHQPRLKVFDQRVSDLLFIVVSFVFLYSFLPHKELRFLFPVIPAINVVNALGLAKMCSSIYKSELKNLCFLALGICVLFSSCLGSVAGLYASCKNYPGAEALNLFNSKYTEMQVSDPELPVPYLHIDTLASQTGVSRFLELNSNWTYSKEENLTDQEKLKFTHLISEKSFVEGFNLLTPVKGFHRINWKAAKVELAEKLFILQRKDIEYSPHREELEKTCGQ